MQYEHFDSLEDLTKRTNQYAIIHDNEASNERTNERASEIQPIRNQRLNCDYCGKTGHESSTCWLKNRFCENCNRPGHNTEECKWPQQTSAKYVPTCETCHQKGHPTKDCNRSNPFPRPSEQQFPNKSGKLIATYLGETLSWHCITPSTF